MKSAVSSIRAIENFTKTILRNQNHGSFIVNQGVFYARTGKKELAVSDFQRACDLGNRPDAVH